VLTEVRKKYNKRHVSEECDGSNDGENEAGDSRSEILSPAFDGVARGKNLKTVGDDSDSSVIQLSASSPKNKSLEKPSTQKNTHSDRRNHDKESSKKMPAKKYFQSCFTSKQHTL
jgi:hypothetical protein